MSVISVEKFFIKGEDEHNIYPDELEVRGCTGQGDKGYVEITISNPERPEDEIYVMLNLTEADRIAKSIDRAIENASVLECHALDKAQF